MFSRRGKKKLLYSKVTWSSNTFTLSLKERAALYYYLYRDEQPVFKHSGFQPRKMYVNLESGKSSFDSMRCLQ